MSMTLDGKSFKTFPIEEIQDARQLTGRDNKIFENLSKLKSENSKDNLLVVTAGFDHILDYFFRGKPRDVVFASILFYDGLKEGNNFAGLNRH